MPQLEFADYLPQLFWLAVTFAILYLYLAKKALPRVSEVLEERENRVIDDLEHAEKHKKESRSLEETYEKLIATARANAGKVLEESKLKITETIEAKQNKSNQAFATKIQQAEAKIEQARSEAMTEIEVISADACSKIVASLSGIKVSKSRATDAVQHVAKGQD